MERPGRERTEGCTNRSKVAKIASELVVQSSPPSCNLRTFECLSKPLQFFPFGNDDDAVFGDREAAGEVGVAIPANLKAYGDPDILVDDRAANARIAANVDT